MSVDKINGVVIMDCKVDVYKGLENYLYFSFAPEDESRVLPILERLSMEGFRIWYQDKENDEIAYERLEKSTVCVLALSEKASVTHNVINKLSWAISNSKPTVLIVLEEFMMTPGMMIQQARATSLIYADQRFFEKLISEKCLSACRIIGKKADPQDLSEWRNHMEIFTESDKRFSVEPAAVIVRHSTGEVFRIETDKVKIGNAHGDLKAPDIVLDDFNQTGISRTHAEITLEDGQYYLQDIGSRLGTFFKDRRLEVNKKVALTDRAVFQLRDEVLSIVLGNDAIMLAGMDEHSVLEWLTEKKDVVKEESNYTVYSPLIDLDQLKNITQLDDLVKEYEETVRLDPVDEKTVHIPLKPVIPEEDWEKTVRQKLIPAAVLRIETGEMFKIKQIVTVLGRISEKNPPDIMFSGNPGISRNHAEIFQYKGRYWLRDCESSFGTFVNGRQLNHEEQVELTDNTQFNLDNEPFLFITGKTLETAVSIGKVSSLLCRKTGERRIIGFNIDSLRLDREHPWAEGILNKSTVSSNHAEVFREGNSVLIRDIGSENGTYLNDDILEKNGKAIELHPRDRISVLDVGFSYDEKAIVMEN